jgi:nucleolar MIF4G domain-containing protein 1
LNRKERRKAEREQKKVQKKQPKGRKLSRNVRPEPESDDDAEEFSEDEASPPPKAAPVQTSPAKPLKGILKKKSESAPEEDREPSPAPQPRVSKALRDQLAAEDAEIAALEKKLGIKGKKKSKSKYDDGLEDLFGDFDVDMSEDEIERGGPSKRKRDEDEDWLASKRRKALKQQQQEQDDEDSDEGSKEEGFGEDFDEDRYDDEVDSGEFDSGMGSEEGSQDEDGFEGFDSEDGDRDEDEDEPEPETAKPRVRENPYVAPVTGDAPQPTKYIPPALRAPPSSDSEALARLKRQIQGLLNRLSDANILTILRDIEQIYQTNARGYVTTTLVDLLMGLLADPTVLQDTFLILHSGFIAAIFKVIGTDFGAQMIERIVSDFDKYYEMNKAGNGKHTTNLVSVMAELYLFQLIGSNLMFDYIRFFLGELSEINTELLLRIVRVSGTQLRQDDPTSLKDIVLLLQKSVSEVGEANLPVRTKFMIETINNLKNNRMKTGVAASAIVSEHTIRMKKHLGSLNSRNLKGTEPIRIGLQDIRNTEKKGKWWLVGASWRNDTENDFKSHQEQNDSVKAPIMDDDGDEGEVDLLQLAREQRMNTDVRRAIFITIMSAADAKDAHVKLLKLNLKRSQEMEIPRIIVHCAGCEKTYNPYYTLLARKFCSDHKTRKCFQFALWDVFKSLGERKDEDDGDSEDEEDTGDKDLSLRKLVNLGKLYGNLIATGGLSIACLKALSFQYLKPKTKSFIEIMLVTVILDSQKKAKDGRNEKGLLEIFVNVDTAPEMIAGMQFFLKKVVRKTDLTANKSEKETVQWACKAIDGMLTRLLATVPVDDE